MFLEREAILLDNESRTSTGKLSDKEYRVYLYERTEGSFDVTVRSGPRGALRVPEDLVRGVPKDAALKVFNARVDRQEKKKYKGNVYTYDTTGAQTLVRGVAREDMSKHQSQLLTKVDLGQTADLIASGEYYVSRKYNGVRLTIEKTGTEIRGINKLNAYVSVPPEIATALKNFPTDFMADGEYVKKDGSWYVFDLVAARGVDLRSKPFFERLSATHVVFQPEIVPLPGIVLVDHARTEYEIKHMLEQGIAEGWEGFVYAKLDASYLPGRTEAMLKHKLVESVTVEIGPKNDVRSVQMLMIDPAGKPFCVGNVQIPPNVAIPEPGSFGEVEYIYASKRSILQQPIWAGSRDDVTRADCSVYTLKYNKEVGRDTRFDLDISR